MEHFPRNQKTKNKAWALIISSDYKAVIVYAMTAFTFHIHTPADKNRIFNHIRAE